MEFSEKLTNLRKQKGLTQAQLAKLLYVSRTAVSKWESGRGYPGIDSLKGIAKIFNVSVDALLSSDELLNVSKQGIVHIRDLVFGLLDISSALLLFLPLLGQEVNGAVQTVCVLNIMGITPYLKALFIGAFVLSVIYGILTLALQNCSLCFWVKNKSTVSLIINILSVLLFTVSRQPYVVVFLFGILIIKVFLVIKNK